MMCTLRLGLLLMLFLAVNAAGQNRVYLQIEPNSPGPAKPLVLEPGKTVHFTATGYEYQSNNLPPVQVPITNLTWTVQPIHIGTITPDGDFTPTPNPSSPGQIIDGKIYAEATVGTVQITAVVPFILGNPQSGAFDYTISGTVSDGGGSPIAGAHLNAYDPAQPTFAPIETTTDANGQYTLKTMRGSFYVVANAAGYIPEYYDNADSPNSATRIVSDTGNRHRTGVDFVLAKAAGVVGRVLDARDNTPITDVELTAMLRSAKPNVMPVYTVFSDQHGVYRFDNMAPGTYVVTANGKGYATQWYNLKSDAASADTIQVLANSVVDHIDFLLVKDPIIPPNSFVITGTVKDAMGNGVNSALVYAENTITMPPMPRPYATRVAADGSYTLQLSGGSWIVRAEAPGFVPEYFDNVGSEAQATQIVLTNTNPRRDHVDFSLGTGGSISGIVRRASDSAPIEMAYVSIYPNAKNPTNSAGIVQGAVTDAHGAYRITGLSAGSYAVVAMKEGFAEQYFDHVADPASATKVAVTDGGNTTDIDFALAGLPSISGTVRSAGGTLLPFAQIYATSVAITPTQPIARYSTRADQHGAYSIVVPAGRYRLQAMAQGYLPEYYDNKKTYDSATTITLNAAGPNVTGIDFSLGTGGSITGRVTRVTDNAPLADAWVMVHGTTHTNPIDPNNSGGAVRTDSTGAYVISGLEGGSYVVVAFKDGFAEQYWDHTADAALASKVAVTEDQTTTGVDFALGRLPGISGRVTDASDNTPIAHAEIRVEGTASNTKPLFIAYSDQNGDYTLPLPPGSYKVRAMAQQYNTEWYNEKPDLATADAVVVPNTGTVSNINFTLARFGGAIAGVATDASQQPLAGVSVKAWARPDPNMPPANTRRYFASTQTGADGSYELKGLPAASYFVSAGGHGYLSEYYDDAATLAVATAVPVGTQKVSGIDFELARGGSISGIVTDGVNNTPIANAFVSVRHAANSVELGARSGQDGSYTIEGLPTGEYVVHAAAPHYQSEYFDDAQDPTLATKVLVTAPSTTHSVNFTLAPATGGKVRFAGKVRSAVTGLPVLLSLVEAVHPVSGHVAVTTPLPDGSFELDAEEGSLLRARALGYIGAYANGARNWEEGGGLTSGGENLFDLEPMSESGFAMLSGHVSDAFTKRGIANAWVYGTDEFGGTWFGTSDAVGAFALSGLSDGDVQLTVSGVQYASSNSSTNVKDGVGNAEMSAQRFNGTTGTGRESLLPSSVVLAQNYPNPFNPSTAISYGLPVAGHVTLRVYTLVGTEVATLVNGQKPAGSHTVSWNASDAPSGIYLYRLETNGYSITRRMTLMK